MKTESAKDLSTPSADAIRTKHGLLVAQIEGNFINHAIAAIHALKSVAQRALHPSTAQGVQGALEVFHRSIDNKLNELQQSMQCAESAWNELLVVRRQAAAYPSKESSHEETVFGFGKMKALKARLSDLSEYNAEMAALLQRMADVTGAYMNAQSNVTQTRSEIASLLNGASLFLTQQVGAQLSVEQDVATSTPVPTQEKERLSVVPSQAAAFQYQPPTPISLMKESVG